MIAILAAKIQSSSKPSGSKKHINKVLKNVIKLYSSFPSEVVSILLEFLLKALESADVALDDWKPLIMKLSNKVPEMLLSLLKANLQMMESRDALTHDSGEHLKPDNNKSRFHETENLSRIFSWLIGNLKDLNRSLRKLKSLEASGTSKDKSLPNSALIDLLRKSLLIPSLGNTHLTTATSVLAQTTANHTLLEKLKKLASLHSSNTTGITYSDSGPFYDQEEKSIREAANNLEFIKRKLSWKSGSKIGENGKKSGRWNVVKSWKPCPIGMLPSDFGSSGVVPVLEIVGGYEENGKSAEWNEKLGGEGKREADCSVGDLDDSDVKKVKLSGEDGDGVLEGVENRLMIGGVWKRVTHDEVVKIGSSVRILV